MVNEIRVLRLLQYPFKSLHGEFVDDVVIDRMGTFQWDRRFCLRRAIDGRVVTAKNDPRLYELLHLTAIDNDGKRRCLFDLSRQDSGNGEVQPSTTIFFTPFSHGSKPRELTNLAERISDHLGYRVTIDTAWNGGYPDEREPNGPTLISLASLREIARWFPGLQPTELIMRLRPNIVISGKAMPPFWEDRLFAAPGEEVQFSIGEVTLYGVKPCARCSVPTRDSRTGTPYSGFAKTFSEKRRAHLPPWSNPQWFNKSGYYASVNTRIPPSEAGKTIYVGAPLVIR